MGYLPHILPDLALQGRGYLQFVGEETEVRGKKFVQSHLVNPDPWA